MTLIDIMPFEDLTKELHAKFPSLQRVENYDRLTARLPVLKLLPKGKVGVELGVFAGNFSQSLFQMAQPSKFYMVDAWHLIFGNAWPSWGPYNDDGKLTIEIAMESARRRASLMDGKAEIVVTRTVNWLAAQPAGSIDWIYSDSGHTYENTLDELRKISSALAQDGIVIGDDCQIDRAHRHHGVFRAIRDFCKEEPFEIIYMDHAKQWAIRRTEAPSD